MRDNDALGSISDTARWVAVFRARETDRPDGLFKDPFARVLAGQRGEQLAAKLPGNDSTWAWSMRTFLFDQFLTRQINASIDTVINLAAGLDTRPYRMRLPRTLRWIEVEFPQIISHKEKVLAGHSPTCELERVPLDLANLDARRELLAGLAKKAKRILVISEGLLVYLTPQQVGGLARDLAGEVCFAYWLVDIVSPGILKILQNTMAEEMRRAGISYKFGPPEGTDFFVPFGWQTLDVMSLLEAAKETNRLPGELAKKLGSESVTDQKSRFWSGVCLLQNVQQRESGIEADSRK
jgi:methyltransferase (TIGR00027 family)